MPATLDDLLSKITSQDDTITKLSTSLATVVETQSTITKALEKPDRGGAFDKVPATPIDPTEEGRFGLVKSLGHFLTLVKSSPNARTPHPDLQKAYEWAVSKAIVGANETIGSEGGFLVPPEFSNKLFARVYKDSALLPKCDNYTVVGNSMTFPRSSETSRVAGSRWGGVTSSWLAEGAASTLSKPGFGVLSLKLHKLMSLGAITDEMSADQSVMPQYMTNTFSKEIDFMVSDAIIRGTGAGQPQGILNATCKVTVSKEAGQQAATINAQNVVKMFARRFAGSTGNLVWLYNQDIEPQLFLMTLGIGTAGVTVFMPPNGLASAPFGTLMGRPLVPIEHCNTLGTEGDLILADLSQYVTITKGGLNSAQSMHFYFDTEQMAFRVSFRMDGQPWWHSALTPYKGSNTQSPIVVLETRS